MDKAVSRLGMPGKVIRNLVAIACAIALVPGDSSVLASQAPSAAPAAQESVKLPNEQLDSLVAPIALYPDPLLSQALVACTYPLEVIQLQQWLGQHKDLKDQALADAVKKQNWDPSVQGLAGLPDVVKILSEDIKWTTDLGNAFLTQQSDVMDAVQRMRKKAQDKGLKSNKQMKVETQTVENKQVIVIQQANPQVIQVPSYDPVVVYGAPAYPYPPIYYPPPPPSGWAVAGGMALSFGVGVAMGAMWSGGWGYNCGWHGGNNNVTINNNNNFNRNANVSGGNRNRGGNTWQHNPQHRGGAPYSDRSTANRFGGTTRGDSVANRQASARQNQARGNRQGSVGDRSSGVGRQQSAAGDRGGLGRDGGGRSSAAGASNFGANRGGGGGGDRVGNRSVGSSGGSSRGSGAFGGGGFSGSGARASSARGSGSMGGGRSRGGGRRR